MALGTWSWRHLARIAQGPFPEHPAGTSALGIGSRGSFSRGGATDGTALPLRPPCRCLAGHHHHCIFRDPADITVPGGCGLSSLLAFTSTHYQRLNARAVRRKTSHEFLYFSYDTAAFFPDSPRVFQNFLFYYALGTVTGFSVSCRYTKDSSYLILIEFEKGK